MEDLAEYVIDAPVVDREQQEIEQWYRQRAGKFTASRFGDLMVSGRGKDETFGQAALSYIYQVAGERIGSYSFPFDSSSTRWGKENERLAFLEYCDRVGSEPENWLTGTDAFIQINEFVGGTPDGVCLPGCVEIKCPYSPQEHVRTLHEKTVPKQYEWQVHGHMLLTAADYCDFVSFDPRITNEQYRMVILRIERDEEKLTQLRDRLVAATRLVKLITGER